MGVPRVETQPGQDPSASAEEQLRDLLSATRKRSRDLAAQVAMDTFSTLEVSREEPSSIRRRTASPSARQS